MPKVRTGLPIADVAIEGGLELARSVSEDSDYDLNRVLGGLAMSEPVAANELDELFNEKRVQIFNSLAALPEEMVSPKLIEKTILDSGIGGADAEDLYDDAMAVYQSTRPETIKEVNRIAEKKKLKLKDQKSFKEASKEVVKDPSFFGKAKKAAKVVGGGALALAAISTVVNTDWGKFFDELTEDDPKRKKSKRKINTVEDIEAILEKEFGKGKK